MERRLRLLGSPQVEVNGEVRDLPVDKPASLVYYLALRADWVSRSELAYLYRPDAPEEVALGNVRVLLHRAKATFTPTGLEVEKSRVRLLVATDVADFHRLARSGDPAALRLYRGPFLKGVSVSESPGYDTWLDLERSHIDQTWRHAALVESARLERSGELAPAAELTGALVAADPLDEEALQAHLRVLHGAGRTLEARAAYDALVRALRVELDAEPLDSTRALFRELSSRESASVTFPGIGSLAASHATMPSPPAPQHNLPTQSTRFVGRRREAEALDAVLSRGDTRLVTITGLGGVGKSRLSLEVATHRLPKHADGVWFVELAATGAPELLPTAIATALRLDLSASRGAHAALVDHLRDKQLLLVLDNFEHLVHGAGVLDGLLAAAPGLVMLVTSRVALALRTETVFELDGLSTPAPGTAKDLLSFDAVALFVDRAERLSTGFVASGATLAAVAELARRVEGMPLALELAASWSRTLSASELVTELGGNLDLLSASLRDLPQRHRSIRTVVDYSWGLLTDAERRALERLSVFRGGFTRAAAEQVAEVHLALLLGLASHSLIKRTQGGRFHMHELVRLFAAEKLAERDEGRRTSDRAPTSDSRPPARTDLHASLSDYYLSLLVERSPLFRTPARAAVLDDLFEDLDNVRLAFADAVSRFDEERLATALPQLFTLYLEAGALDEFTARLHDLAEEVSARGSTHRRLWVEVMLQLGRAHMSHGEFGAARVELEPVAQQLRLAAGPDADATLARVLDWLGSCARIMGDREAAEDHVTEALRLADGLPGRLADEALALQSDLTYNLASLRQVQGRSEEALQLHERSLDLCLRAGADVSAALRRLSIAHIKIVSGAGLDEAQRHLDEALAVGRAARASRVEGGALNALAVLSGAQGDQAGAERFHLESLALARQQGQQDDQRAALANLGGILNGQARLDEAAVYLRRALELAQRTGNPGGLNQAYTLVAENCSLRGDHGAAAAHLRAALDPEVLAGTPAVGQAQCLSLLANVHERAGRSDRARELRLHLLAHPATPPGLKRKIEGTLGASERGHAADGASEHGPATDRASKHGPAADRASAPSETRSLLELAAEHRAVLGRTPAWTSGGTPERTPGGT